MGSTGPMAANRTLYRDLGYDPEKDLEPISLFAHFPILVVVSAKLPIKSARRIRRLCEDAPKTAQLRLGRHRQLATPFRRLFRAGHGT